MKVMRVLLLVAVGILSVSVRAQSDSSSYNFTLAEAQQYAIDNYYLTMNAELDIESAEKKIWETTAIGLPQISGGVNYTYLPEVPEAPLGGQFIYDDNEIITGAHLRNPLEYGAVYQEAPPVQFGLEHDIAYNVLINQLLFSGEYLVGLQASKTYKRFSEESYERTSIELKEMVAGTYFSILILQKNEELLTGTLDNLQKIYNDTEKSSAVGLIESTEADQIAINVKRTENTLNTITRQIEFMQKMLKYQLGLTLDSELLLKDDLKTLIEFNLINISSFSDFDLEGHVEYRMLATQEQLNQLSMKQQKSRYLPTLSAFYRYENRFEDPTVNFSPTQTMGVSMSVPIFESGSKNAKVSQARIEMEKSQNMKTQESQRLIMSAEQARFDYLNALETYYNEEENYQLSSTILQNTTEKYNQGMVSSMDLTLANNQFLEAQLTFSTAMLDLLNAKITLDKAFSKL